MQLSSPNLFRFIGSTVPADRFAAIVKRQAQDQVIKTVVALFLHLFRMPPNNIASMNLADTRLCDDISEQLSSPSLVFAKRTTILLCRSTNVHPVSFAASNLKLTCDCCVFAML